MFMTLFFIFNEHCCPHGMLTGLRVCCLAVNSKPLTVHDLFYKVALVSQSS